MNFCKFKKMGSFFSGLKFNKVLNKCYKKKHEDRFILYFISTSCFCSDSTSCNQAFIKLSTGNYNH